jgi:hypothetical protein
MEGLIRPSVMLCFICLPSVSTAAEIVRAEIGKEAAWTGEAVPLIVTLYSPGPFSGTASFDLPRLPRTAFVKAGNPVVASQDVGGQSYFTQRHEFTIFTQNAGGVIVPGFPVRFAGKASFLSDPEPMEGVTPELHFQSKRPPGTDNMGVVVAVTRMEVTQIWNPSGMDTVVAGDVIERSITRRATGTTAMMLPPVSFDATEGVRLYSADPILEDHIERGASWAERRDRIKYQFERLGTFQLPSVSLVWWDPQAEKLQQETLPGATINVAGTIEAAATVEHHLSPSRPGILALITLAMLVAGWLLYKPVRKSWKRWQARCQDPEVLAVRRLLSACRSSDAPAAYAALVQWTRIVSASESGPDLDKLLGSAHTAGLRNEWKALSEHIFAVETSKSQWSGQQLAEAVVRARHELRQTKCTRRERFALPPLNPASPTPERATSCEAR